MAVLRHPMLAGILLVSVPALAGPADLVALPSEPGRWSARTELMYDDATKSLVRREIRVWDLHPSRRFVFTWAPTPPRAAAAGAASGFGHLTWRPDGMPSYDLSGIAIDYQGRLVDGRPDGEGTERDADGVSYEGQWKAGLPDGRGHLRLATGADYEGSFRDGKAEGHGVYVDVDGETYDGVFRDGLREGIATTTLPDHVKYRSTWRRGEEVASSRRIRLAQLGSVGGNADQDIRIGITVDGHAANDGLLGYMSAGSGAALRIVPDNRALMAVWKGNGDLAQNADSETGTFGFAPTDLIPVRLTMNVQNRGEDTAQVVGAVINVDSSRLDLQPAVEIRSPASGQCGPGTDDGIYAPTFRFENYGWGSVRNAQIQYAFVNNYTPTLSSAAHLKFIPAFDRRQNVNFDLDLSGSGARVSLLRNMGQKRTPFSCQGMDVNTCFASLKNSGVFGSLSPYVTLKYDYIIEIGVGGLFVYDWTDDEGVTQHRTSPFRTTLLLGELPQTAECGEGGEPVPVARNPIELQLEASDYRLPIRFQSVIPSGRTARYSFSLHAARSSDHQLSIVLQLADGREIASRPIAITYFVPDR